MHVTLQLQINIASHVFLVTSILYSNKTQKMYTLGKYLMIVSILLPILLSSSLSFGVFPIRGRHSRYQHFYNMAFVLRSNALPATNHLFRGKSGPPVSHIKVEASR